MAKTDRKNADLIPAPFNIIFAQEKLYPIFAPQVSLSKIILRRKAEAKGRAKG
jgi:hypothetical protein